MDELDSKIKLLSKWIGECPEHGLVFLGGAGVSTESGIPDFRSPTGLYGKPYEYDYPPETMISRSFFDARPQDFFDFYVSRMLFLEAAPNDAHMALAKLEQMGKLSAVITQNIDGLHQAAGSLNVLELHGSVWRNYCMGCGKSYTVEELKEAAESSEDGVPRCQECNGIIKPDVVLYEESLDGNVLRKAVDAIRSATMMIVAGTSLAVYPAAGLLDYFNGEHLVIINKAPTSQDKKADLCIDAKVGEVLATATKDL